MKQRLAELDGIRGCAIALVLIWHYFANGSLSAPDSGLKPIQEAFILTWSGVDLFFVLSGFLIGGILMDNREAPNYFKVFYVRRICRIFPIYFMVLAMFLVIRHLGVCDSPPFDWLFDSPMPTWSYATFTQNFAMGEVASFGARWMGATWSLAIEEQFYLLLPLTVSLTPKKWLPALLLMGIVAAPTLRAASPGFYAFVNTPWRGDSVLTGVLLAYCVRSSACMSLAAAYKKVFLVSFLVLATGAVAITLGILHLGFALEPLWIALLYGCVVVFPFVYQESRLRGILRWGPLTRLGIISYGVYLFHLPVAGLLHGLIRHAPPELNTWTDGVVMLLSLAVTLCLATLSYLIIEKPIIAIGHRYAYDGICQANVEALGVRAGAVHTAKKFGRV
jgi:peptidoglycan/LPS O-acetylase OafA/YrhL